MKKFSLTLSALLLMGMLTACGSNQDGTASPTPPVTASPNATTSPKVSESPDLGEDMKDGMEDAGEKMKDAGEDIKDDLTGQDKDKENE